MSLQLEISPVSPPALDALLAHQGSFDFVHGTAVHFLNNCLDALLAHQGSFDFVQASVIIYGVVIGLVSINKNM